MNKVYTCPHCHTQNFATKARLRLVKKIHLKCWKCGREIDLSLPPLAKRRKKISPFSKGG